MTSAQYGAVDYWNERYSRFTLSRDLEPFDWYQRYGGIKSILNKYIKLNTHILMVGCGTSRLSEEMSSAGYKAITNIDISQVVITHMTEKYRDNPSLTFLNMSVLSMEFSDSYFDAVVDKATLDGILCGEGSTSNIDKMCSEVSRVLKPGGVFVVVSHGAPDKRLRYLDKPKYNWKVEVQPVEKPKIMSIGPKPGEELHYVYILTKN